MSMLTDRRSFKLWTSDKLRYNDLDRQNHVNNAVFATFSETGRVAFLLYDEAFLRSRPGTDFVIARIEIDYRGELRYPGSVDIGTRVLHIGRSSMRLGQGIFDGERCVATVESVVVMIDENSRKACPFSPETRALLAALQAQ
jgi:acyl-CoA thioester hydrolase